MKNNYNEKMKQIIKNLDYVPTLLLHSCCGPCSTEVINRLTPYFKITIFYYNPNIEPYEEYLKRKNEQIRFINLYQGKNEIDFLDSDYENEEFLKIAKGFEEEKEGGLRCHRCYELRLWKTADVAKEKGYDYFGTTLSVSPYKNAEVLNFLGQKIANDKKINFLYSDFKKENGYLNSIKFAKEYNLYRQDYCGCQYSKNLSLDE